jgi:hypothetical protein
LNNELDTFVEDGSLEEVGNELVHYWTMWQKKEHGEMLDKFAAEAMASATNSSVTAMCKADDQESSSEEEDEVLIFKRLSAPAPTTHFRT